MRAQRVQKQNKLLSREIYCDLLQCHFYFPCLLCVVAVKDHSHGCWLPDPLGPTFLHQLGTRPSCWEQKARTGDIPVVCQPGELVRGSWRRKWSLVLPHGLRLRVRPIMVVAKKELDATTRDAKKGNRDGRLRRNPSKQRIMSS